MSKSYLRQPPPPSRPDQLLPSLGVGINGLAVPGDWQPIFGRCAPIELEIGFGWDTFLLDEARRRPGIDFIGIEHDKKRVESLVRRANRQQVHNVRAVLGDALYCLPRFFNPAQIHRTYIHFPDPWHKKRQQKHRLLGPFFLKVLFYHIKPGGDLVVGTDSASYRDEIHQNLAGLGGGVQNLNHPALWTDHLPDHPETKFERLFRSQGKEIYYFHYRRDASFEMLHGEEMAQFCQTIPRRMPEMPHAVFTQSLDLRKYVASFSPFSWKDERALYKINDIWISHRRKSLLMEAVIIIDGHDRLFYVELAEKEQKTVLRISPLRDVERDELLFRFLAGLVKHLLEFCPEASLTRHNLGRCLENGINWDQG